jgi:hypothetical protein
VKIEGCAYITATGKFHRPRDAFEIDDEFAIWVKSQDFIRM